MPTFNADAIARLADLTKIGLADGEAETLAAELSGIAAGWDAVAGENVDDTPPWTQPIQPNPWRGDKVGAMFSQEEAAAHSGKSGDDMFLVPEIL